MYTKEMLESIKKVEATRAERLANVKAGIHPRRMTAEEKEQVKMENHPDYIASQFAELQIGPNKGEMYRLSLQRSCRQTAVSIPATLTSPAPTTRPTFWSSAAAAQALLQLLWHTRTVPTL